MGLSLCYRLILPGSTSIDDIRAKLAALKEFAAGVGFEGLHGPTEYTADELCAADDRDIVKILASVLCGNPPDFYGFAASQCCATAFLIAPGKECEPAIIGFVAPGSRRAPLDPDDDLHAGEWFWSGCCKTQYASMVSEDHFVRCHVGLIRVLDHAATLGITVQVEDESGYWTHRSTETLLKVVRDMNRLIARIAGEMDRRWHEKHQIDAPIFDHPDFEHLEMEELEFLDQADGGDPRVP